MCLNFLRNGKENAGKLQGHQKNRVAIHQEPMEEKEPNKNGQTKTVEETWEA